jgi:uncharacterized Zn-binding protein involved in type VI secretion
MQRVTSIGHLVAILGHEVDCFGQLVTLAGQTVCTTDGHWVAICGQTVSLLGHWVASCGQTVITEAHWVAVFGHWVGTPPQKVTDRAVADELQTVA